jgi:hypothetical protein
MKFTVGHQQEPEVGILTVINRIKSIRENKIKRDGEKR